MGDKSGIEEKGALRERVAEMLMDTNHGRGAWISGELETSKPRFRQYADAVIPVVEQDAQRRLSDGLERYIAEAKEQGYSLPIEVAPTIVLGLELGSAS